MNFLLQHTEFLYANVNGQATLLYGRSLYKYFHGDVEASMTTYPSGLVSFLAVNMTHGKAAVSLAKSLICQIRWLQNLSNVFCQYSLQMADFQHLPSLGPFFFCHKKNKNLLCLQTCVFLSLKQWFLNLEDFLP